MRTHRLRRLGAVRVLVTGGTCSPKAAPELSPAPRAPSAAGGARGIALIRGSPSSLPRANWRGGTPAGSATTAGSGPSSTTASVHASAGPRRFQRLFGFPAPPIVLFTSRAPKTEAIIRSPVSYHERPFQPGQNGEEILADSAD